MSESKYGKLITSHLQAPPQVMAALPNYSKMGKRILWIDNNVVKGSFQMNCSWYFKSTTKGPAPHAHDSDEIIAFFGNNPEDPWDLGGEIEMWMEDQPFFLKKSTLLFVPRGVKHCPLILRQVNRPIIHFTTVTEDTYIMADKGWIEKPVNGYADHVVTTLKMPPEKMAIEAEYNKYAKRVLWMDENVVPGAFHMNVAWYLKAAPTLENVPHVHEQGEIIGFLGSNWEDPADLCGEIELWIADEKHIITRSSMVYIPAGLKHCPLILRRVDRPIFHYTVVPNKRYIKTELK
jgi:mannose-6-phosphate isomerase-like protein (cupin superfamily)